MAVEIRTEEDRLGSELIGAAIEVHRSLGPGLLESTYEECLCHELSLRGIDFRRQVAMPVNYKRVQLDCGYRLDLLIEEKVIVEIKAAERIDPIHLAQLMTYLKLSGLKVGYLLNFNARVLKAGIRRILNA